MGVGDEGVGVTFVDVLADSDEVGAVVEIGDEGFLDIQRAIRAIIATMRMTQTIPWPLCMFLDIFLVNL